MCPFLSFLFAWLGRARLRALRAEREFREKRELGEFSETPIKIPTL